MNKAKLRSELGALLAKCEDTGFFLEGVSGAIEDLYADDEEGGCPEGFAALDTAVQAFIARECEGDDDEGDDDDDEEE